MIDIILITYNSLNYTIECIESLKKTGEELNIIIVDNASSDNSQSVIQSQYPEIKFIRNIGNLGYAKAVNIGMRAASNEFAIISNNDVIYRRNTIQILMDTLKANPKAAVVSPQQEYPDGMWQYSWGELPGLRAGLKDLFLVGVLGRAHHEFWYKYRKQHRSRQVPYCDGAVLAVRRSAFNTVNGFDEDYFFYAEEADFCKRIADNGFKCMFNPKAVLTHARGGSSKSVNSNEKSLEMLVKAKLLFCSKHRSNSETAHYIKLEIMHSAFMIALWSAIGIFKNNNKIEYYKILKSIWSKESNKR